MTDEPGDKEMPQMQAEEAVEERSPSLLRDEMVLDMR